jgi:hypothetical protein
LLKYIIEQLISFILSLFFSQPQTPPALTPQPYYYFYQINKNDNFSVITNFDNPKDSTDLIKENNCKYAINGGLYQENNKPLGLFFKDNKLINKKINSNIFNGFLTQDQNNILDISKTNPSNSKFTMQTGPFFNLNSTQIKYNEKTSRRHVLAKDSLNNLYIFSIFSPDSLLSGPSLNEIPQFFQKPEIKKIADFKDILTLDGGSASVFYSPNASVHENTFIGSLLCWK